MTRILVALVLLAGGAARAGLLDDLLADSQKKREVEAGLGHLRTFFTLDAKGDPKDFAKRDKSMQDFLDWLAKTPATLGVDLASKPDDFVDLLDRARVNALPKSIRGGAIEYEKGDFEFTFRVPKGYKADTRWPLVVTMHARVINPNHPAFKNDSKRFVERGRAAVHDYWLDVPVTDEVVVVAPTGLPTGFEFQGRYYEDLRALMYAFDQAMAKCRVDWNRTILEVQGLAMRVVCEHPMLFSGYIVRDGEVAPEHYFMFENLNGVPLLYVADEKRWASVGKPLTEALQAAYKAAGAEENLVVLRAQRDANDALKGDPQRVAEFVRRVQRRPLANPFRWRFFRDTMVNALPCDHLAANFAYEPGVPLDQTAGRLAMQISRETFTAEEGEKPLTKISIDVTEAEGLRLYLSDAIAPLDEAITIVVNGATLHEKKRFRRDPNYFIARMLPRRFFMLPYMGEVDLTFPLKPQFVKPKPPEEAPGEAGAGEAKPEGGPSAPAGGEEPEDEEKPAGASPPAGEEKPDGRSK